MKKQRNCYELLEKLYQDIIFPDIKLHTINIFYYMEYRLIEF